MNNLEKALEQYQFVVRDIEAFDKKPLLMFSYKCDVQMLDNFMKNGKRNCKGCESSLQCCKFNVVMELFARFKLKMVKVGDFQSAIQLIITEAKTQSEVFSIANASITQ